MKNSPKPKLSSKLKASIENSIECLINDIDIADPTFEGLKLHSKSYRKKVSGRIEEAHLICIQHAIKYLQRIEKQKQNYVNKQAKLKD